MSARETVHLAGVELDGRFRLRVLRPEDHLVLTVTGVGLRGEVDAHGVPHLLADGSGRSALVVGFPPQHVAEQVFQEHQGSPGLAGAPETPVIPVGARFAHPSRLAFEMGPGADVELTVDGLLSAMSRLRMQVAPLAVPRWVWRWASGVTFSSLIIEAMPRGLVEATADIVVGAVPSGHGRILERLRATRVLHTGGPAALVRRLPAEARRVLVTLPADRRFSVDGPLAEVRPAPADVARLLLNPNPVPPNLTQTVIEIPSRLQLSPSVDGGWSHAIDIKEERGDGTGPVELWHSRLGVRVRNGDDVSIDETDATQRTVRGVWTRDLMSWTGPHVPVGLPFTTSTSPSDRVDIVGLSTGAGRPSWAIPEPVDVDKLYLTSLGAILDVKGAWTPYAPYRLQEWQHRATLGRDQYVKVVTAGYLYPFGHRASLVKETRRKVDPGLPGSADTAILWQRWFIILRERSRSFQRRDLPFTSVTLAPASTPDLDQPDDLVHPGSDPPALFWPSISGTPVPFTVTAVDQDGITHVFSAPLLFVTAPMPAGVGPHVLSAYGVAKDAQGFRHVGPDDRRVVLDLAGRHLAVAPKAPSGDAAYEARALRFAADPGALSAEPTLLFADLVVNAVAAVTGTKEPLRLTYAAPYLTHGFTAANSGEVVLATARDATPGQVTFGTTDRSGGFLNPSQRIDGISRAKGPVADVASSASGAPVDPTSYFAGMGKLFGLFELPDILHLLGADDVPAYASRMLDLAGGLANHAAGLAALLPSSPQSSALAAAWQAVDDVLHAPPPDVASTAVAVQPLLAALAGAVSAASAGAVVDALAPAQRALASRALDTLDTLLAIPLASEVLADLAHGVPVAQVLSHVHLEWSPALKGNSILTIPTDGLLLAVDVRGGDLVPSPSAEILAQLSNFTLHLLPGLPLVDIHVDRLLFRAATGSKADVEVVMGGLEWLGILGFVAKLKDLIPLDGFSDPPSIEVDTAGITAGFSVALPNIAVGVFNLSNLSLAADVGVPFIGTAPTVGFSFCSRERPFTLAVMFLGGGGFFGLRLQADGLVLLEASLEFGACLALDFGVASGSVSCMAGVYLRLEAKDGSLTGYLRIRGEVDVLGLISASIEMYMGLTYQFGSGKVIGQATITVSVEVLFFSGSVSISCERTFAGSKGDPTFDDAMGPYPDIDPWLEYCQAFAEA